MIDQPPSRRFATTETGPGRPAEPSAHDVEAGQGGRLDIVDLREP
jgi:hypothetical protein